MENLFNAFSGEFPAFALALSHSNSSNDIKRITKLYHRKINFAVPDSRLTVCLHTTKYSRNKKLAEWRLKTRKSIFSSVYSRPIWLILFTRAASFIPRGDDLSCNKKKRMSLEI